jgi:hypothetical protein
LDTLRPNVPQDHTGLWAGDGSVEKYAWLDDLPPLSQINQPSLEQSANNTRLTKGKRRPDLRKYHVTTPRYNTPPKCSNMFDPQYEIRSNDCVTILARLAKRTPPPLTERTNIAK